MNELEKLAKKRKLIEGMKEFGARAWGGRGRKIRKAMGEAPDATSRAAHRGAASLMDRQTRKARLQLAGGAAGLVGGGLLARRLLRGSSSSAGGKAMRFLKRNKMPLAVGGGVAGTVGALAALRKKRDR